MSMYRKKPVVIEAEQFFIGPDEPIGENQMFMQWPVQRDEKGLYLHIEVLGRTHRINNGDWIIKDEKVKYDICPSEIFQAMYEEVED